MWSNNETSSVTRRGEDSGSNDALNAAGQQSKAAFDNGECCGLHANCEKGLRILRDENLYYNDEELDAYKGIPANELTAEQAAEIREVFETLMPKEVGDWVCAMQARGISLPPDIREEALLIISEN